MATEAQIVGFLEHVPLFLTLTNRQLQRLAKHFVQREFDPGTVIVNQGEGGQGFFIIETGAVEVIRTRADNTRMVVNHFGPTDFFGEMALLDDGMRTASVVAKEPTTCLVLTRWEFFGVLKDDPDMTISILVELAKRFRQVLDSI
jgi:CRP-like cAMP-binding protein